MKMSISSKEFNVDISPLKDNTREAIMNLIKAGDMAATLMRPAVKGACIIAMPYLGIKKANRNDDPIELVCLFLVEHIFSSLEANGLILEGKEIIAPPLLEVVKEVVKEGEEVGS